MVDSVSNTPTYSTSTTNSIASLAKNFDSFLKLLTVQLKNQDPTSPMETNEFTNQIVMFTQVEQQINMNKNLEQLIAFNKNATVSSAVSYMGKKIEVESSKFAVTNGMADISYRLPESASEVSITISNASGNVLRKIDVANVAAGKNKIEWDGKDSNGSPVADGTYNFNVTAKNAAGATINNIPTYENGVVTSVDINGENTMLYIGDRAYKVTDVKAVSNTTTEMDEIQIAQAQMLAYILNDINSGNALSYVGKKVEAISSLFNRTDGTQDVTYQFPEDVIGTTINIYNKDGDLVRTLSGNGEGGKMHQLEWDGMGDDGQPVEDGLYTIEVTGTSAANASSITAVSYIKENVTSVETAGINSLLLFGDIAAPLTSITRVF